MTVSMCERLCLVIEQIMSPPFRKVSATTRDLLDTFFTDNNRIYLQIW